MSVEKQGEGAERTGSGGRAAWGAGGTPPSPSALPRSCVKTDHQINRGCDLPIEDATHQPPHNRSIEDATRDPPATPSHASREGPNGKMASFPVTGGKPLRKRPTEMGRVPLHSELRHRSSAQGVYLRSTEADLERVDLQGTQGTQSSSLDAWLERNDGQTHAQRLCVDETVRASHPTDVLSTDFFMLD